MTGRKQNEKGAVKTASGSQDAKPDKDKLDASASRSDEKKSAKKGEVKTPDKPLEIKRPELKQPQNNQNKKTSNQVAKTIKLAPTPKPSPKPSPKASPKPSPTVSPVTPAVANSVANSTPKGEGTFTLEVCAVSGLLPVRGVCKTTVRKRFKLGSEPTKYCSAARHGGA